MGALKNACMEEIEMRADREDCLNDNEFFEGLNYAGVEEITWSESLNNDYQNWIYFNIK